MIDLRVLTFAEARQPEFKEQKGVNGGFIKYGDKNDYPEYLVDLFNKSAKHNAIVKSKVHYITGNGWTGGDDATSFIEKANRSESLNDITRKVSLDIELFGGAYLEIIWNALGQIAEMWHIDYTRIRTNKDNTQFWYKESWKDSKEEPIIYQAFNPSLENKKKQILYIKEYRPNIGIYALPTYMGCLNYIEADIEISKHILGNAQTGFSASKLITLPNGEPTDDEKKKVDDRIRKSYSGADGKKYMIAFVNDATRKPIIDDLGSSDITKEDFGRVDTLIQTNIFSGHQVTTPSIFGIAEAGKLGSRNEMRDGYEIFKNTYVNAKQMHLESVFNSLAQINGITSEIKILPTEPISFEFSENALLSNMTKDEIRERLNLPVLEDNASTSAQKVVDGISALSPLVANKVLESMTADEIRALVGLEPKGEPAPAPAAPEQVQANMSEQFSVFYEVGEKRENFSIWKTSKRFSDDSDAYFFAEVSQLESNILEQINKQKNITPEVLAEVLDESVDTINKILKDLEDKKIIKSKEVKIGKGKNQDIEIERTLTKPLNEIVQGVKPETTEILVRYSYEWKKGFDNSDKPNSRPFCVALLDADKLYSRSDIETMSARLGYSVWDRKGGWYTQADGTASPECRHEWKTNIVTRKR